MCAQAAGTKAPAGASTDAKEVGHPLCGFVPTIVDSFEEWVKEWRSTTHLYARLGLVHSLAPSPGGRGTQKWFPFFWEWLTASRSGITLQSSKTTTTLGKLTQKGVS